MGSIRSQSWQCSRSDWEANEDSPNQKEGMPFGGLETSLPSECEGFLLFLLHLAGNLHWDSNSEEICGGDGGSMKSQESSAVLAKDEQRAPLTKTPKLSFPLMLIIYNKVLEICSKKNEDNPIEN